MIDRADLKTILRVAVHVAKVDKHFVEEERRMLGRLMAAMHLSPTERRAMLRDETPLSELVESLSTPEARHLLVMTVCGVSAVDGFVAAVEERFFAKVASTTGERMDIPPKDRWMSYVDEVHQAFVTFGDEGEAAG